MTTFRAHVASVVGVVFVALLAACTTSSNGLPNVEPADDSTLGGGGAGMGTGGVGGDGGGVAPIGGRMMPVTCVPPEKKKDLGAACGCNEECGSAACVDGVCCSGACNGTCQACNIPGKMGSCSAIPAGMAPVVAGQCKKDDVGTCGSDGTCDGAGACRRYPDGTTCDKGMCDGAAVKGAKVCKASKCETGPNTICSPFNCDPATVQCLSVCKADGDCAKGQTCKNGSCGKKNLGAVCAASGECDSGFCADGVCCNTTCDGACVSCNQLSKMGECTAVTKDQVDPHKVCKVDTVASCGSSGTCDGSGGCAKYGPATTCQPTKCEGANLVPASTCDGKGSCRTGNQVACAPNACIANACNQVCTSDAQCSAGNVCRNGSCGLRGIGQDCSTNAQCGTGFCIDGVCCENSCTGQCKFCASSQAKGRCLNVAASTPDPRGAAGVTDPAKVCIAQPMNSCGRNGMCNGNAGCQLWDNGTMCEAQSCAAATNTVSNTKLCDGFGACKATGSQSCPPYKCNGSQCGNACGSDNDCVAPNTCISGKCGPKPPGAICNNNNECGSKFCRQGVCCQTDCKGSCFSCSLPSSRGSCTAVPSGALDPGGVCKDDGVASCDRDGTCDGTGKCRLYASGQTCAGATCAGGSATGISTCNGTGDCRPGAVSNCGEFKCNPAGTACYQSCVDSTQCVSPRVCMSSSCGKKPVGSACPTGAVECASGFCTQGVCCDKACTGLCTSCVISGQEGKCVNIPKGSPDVGSRCMATAPPTCGNDGFCDGAGACSKFGPTVPCRDQSCPSNSTTQTLAATCDGAGNCGALRTRDCQLIKCDPQTAACLSGCSVDMQCVSASFCDIATMSCGGLKDNGTACTTGNQCKAGKCIEGVCCGLAGNGNACPACQSCAIAGKAGTCQALPAGTLNAGNCTAGAGVCGQQACDGAGACIAANPSGTACGTPVCASDTKVQAQACNSSMSCVGGATTDCSPGYRCVAGACKTSCTVATQATDCVAGKVCESGLCVTPKLVNGAICSTGDQCASGSCADGVCCNVGCGGTCQACNLAGTVGTCASLAAGADDAACSATATGDQCKYGKCAANGVCAANVCASTCSPDALSAMGSTCNGTATCGSTTNLCMNGFKCVGTACATQCTMDAQCQTDFYCAVSTGKCEAKKAPGGTCTASVECPTAAPTCTTEGVCCATACDGKCSTCSAAATPGMCVSIAAGGTPRPGVGTCMASSPTTCGDNGLCNGAGACQKWSGVSSGGTCGTGCVPPAMVGGSSPGTVPLFCDGSGLPTGCTVQASMSTACSAAAECTIVAGAGTCTAIRLPPIVVLPPLSRKPIR